MSAKKLFNLLCNFFLPRCRCHHDMYVTIPYSGQFSRCISLMAILCVITTHHLTKVNLQWRFCPVTSNLRDYCTTPPGMLTILPMPRQQLIFSRCIYERGTSLTFWALIHTAQSICSFQSDKADVLLSELYHLQGFLHLKAIKADKTLKTSANHTRS
jgi:hypothetical protein